MYDKNVKIVGADGKMMVGAVEALKAASMVDDITTVGVVSIEDDGYLIENREQAYAIFVDWRGIGTLIAASKSK